MNIIGAFVKFFSRLGLVFIAIVASAFAQVPAFSTPVDVATRDSRKLRNSKIQRISINRNTTFSLVRDQGAQPLRS